jgi:hypothetical protein
VDKPELLANILDAHAPIAAAGMLLPLDALHGAAPGLPAFRRKDVLAHVAWWNDHSVAVVGGVGSGEDPFPPTAEPWDLDAQNAATLTANHDVPAEEVVAWEARSFDALVTVVAAATPAELTTPGYRAWLGSGTCADMVGGDSVTHYPEHAPHVAHARPGLDHRLLEAAAAGDAAATRRLVAAGSPLEDRGDGLRTPLMAAVRGRHVEVARVLLEAGADVDARDGLLDTPFLAAGRSGDVELLALLATFGADAALTNRYGGTALIPACERGHESAVEYLLERTLVEVNHRNRLGWTGLMEAVLLGDGGDVQERIVARLLEGGADASIPDYDGRTPLDHARRLGFVGLAGVLEGR